MVRTRRANKTKRYTEFAYSPYDDDDEDGTAPPVETGADDLSDFEAEQGEDEVSAAEDDLSEAAADNPADLYEIASGAGPVRNKAADSKRSLSKPSTPSRHGVDYHQLPPYPLDARIPTRAYTGPLKRGVRSGILRDLMYGPEYSKAKLIWDLYERWFKYAVLPPRHPPQHPQGVLPSPWVPPGFERDQEKLAAKWYGEYSALSTEKSQSRTLLQKHGERLIPQGQGDLTVLLGPVGSQKEVRFSTSMGLAFSASGLPLGEPDSPDDTPSGWMVDVGGIVVSLGWAPFQTGDKQILALAVIPHSDQARPKWNHATETEDDKKHGCLQFWEFTWDRDGNGAKWSSRNRPRFLMAKCFDWGRPRRMQWCPVSLDTVGLYGTLAVLCGDGRVRVLEVKTVPNSETKLYEWIDAPVATLAFTDNYNVEVTCFTWVGCNRLALGHTDGSITLWSIYPTQILQRHAVHASHVLDISSGYPSMPHMVASVPVGGFTTLVDLSNPTSESTYVAAPGIQFQPGLLEWSDHLQGWLVLAPAGGPGLNTVVFLSVRYFPLAKSMLTSMSMPLCVSVRGNHPFGLVGCADGSVWSFNALSKLFRQRDEDAFKIKIFEHEFRPVDDDLPGTSDGMEVVDCSGGSGKLRGASRVLQGFLPEVNDDPRSERLRELNKQKLQNSTKKKAAKGKKKGKAGRDGGVDDDEVEVGADAAGGGEGDVSAHMASRMVIHEPLTRVTATAWNPNVEFATWAAVALGSGLVRVIDVGVE
ncbi:Transcription factor tau subunit sfc6 [Coniochaeta hoffmannii]|uniref:Transcription factor tau subunit sfc6 n=1 Tax=Coniochaeta hoffmannii TaxID=91930 RepID=A0AA38RUX5_9PEZI|nr:Transcription factor tau subunit sfc6 [Coniochaeta hoffmannii]